LVDSAGVNIGLEAETLFKRPEARLFRGGFVPSEEAIRTFVEMLFFKTGALSERMIEMALDILNRPDSSGFINAFLKSALSIIQTNLKDRLSEIKAPTLIVWGREDRVLPWENGVVMNQAIKGSRLKIIERCGHLPMMEKAEDFNTLVTDFLRQC